MTDNFRECYSILENIEERNDKIHNIKDDMVKVSEIMKDLRYLVFSQQTHIDTIEDYMIRSKEHVDCAEKELEKAEINHAKSGRTYVLMTAVLMMAVGTPVSVLVGAKAGIIVLSSVGIGSVIWKGK